MLDNNYGTGCDWGPGKFWINGDCPLHGKGGTRLMGGRECDVVSAEATGTSLGAEPAATTSVKDTAAGGVSREYGSEGSRQSKSGSGRTRGRRTATTDPYPPSPDPPSLDVEAEAERLLGDKKALYSVLKKELLIAYLLEVKAGKDQKANPQHSRASRKQAKELAELLARLTNEETK